MSQAEERCTTYRRALLARSTCRLRSSNTSSPWYRRPGTGNRHHRVHTAIPFGPHIAASPSIMNDLARSFAAAHTIDG
jgi:hypothetical protein